MRLPTVERFKCHSALSFVQRQMVINTATTTTCSGGMRKSDRHVDDAGDASNTEIGHVAYFEGSGNLREELSRGPKRAIG
jgi:hypothetical protein